MRLPVLRLLGPLACLMATARGNSSPPAGGTFAPPPGTDIERQGP